MEIIIADKNFERMGVIDNAEIIWTTRYYKTGDFELYISSNDARLDLILNGFYVIRDDITNNNIGVIEDITIKNTIEQGDMITVTGRLAQGYFLGSRVVSQQTQLNCSVLEGIKSLITANIIDPTDEKRRIDFILFGDFGYDLSDRLQIQTTGDNLLTKVEEICEEKKVGFTTMLIDNVILFYLYKGENKAYDQSKNAYIIFSDEYDNLQESSYIRTTSALKNFAYVAGEGEGLDRKIVTAYAGEEPTGQDRFEIWVDQRNISSNNEEITEAELVSQMKEQGLEEMVGISEAFDGNVILKGYTYREDFDLGDIVQLYRKQWGLGVAMRVVECIESWNNTGKTTVLTFGN